MSAAESSEVIPWDPAQNGGTDSRSAADARRARTGASALVPVAQEWSGRRRVRLSIVVADEEIENDLLRGDAGDGGSGYRPMLSVDRVLSEVG
jgi:hypothetical protein